MQLCALVAVRASGHHSKAHDHLKWLKHHMHLGMMTKNLNRNKRAKPQSYTQLSHAHPQLTSVHPTSYMMQPNPKHHILPFKGSLVFQIEGEGGGQEHTRESECGIKNTNTSQTTKTRTTLPQDANHTTSSLSQGWPQPNNSLTATLTVTHPNHTQATLNPHKTPNTKTDMPTWVDRTHPTQAKTHTQSLH